MSVFDKLGGRLDDDKPEGISTLDIADLPRTQRQIMFFLLRDQHAALDGVTIELLKHQFEAETEAHLSEVLAELCKVGWLILFGEPPNVHYKANLRRKRGTQLSGVWSFVMDRVEKGKAKDPESVDADGNPVAPMTDKAKSDQVWDYVSEKLSDAPAQKPPLWNFKF